MEIPVSGVILAAWCFLLAAVVCGRGAFAASGIVLHTSMLEPSGDLCSRTRANSAPCSSLLERTRAALACSSGLGMLERIERQITSAPIYS